MPCGRLWSELREEENDEELQIYAVDRSRFSTLALILLSWPNSGTRNTYYYNCNNNG